jgi:hypothetical protein
MRVTNLYLKLCRKQDLQPVDYPPAESKRRYYCRWEAIKMRRDVAKLLRGAKALVKEVN